MIDKYAAERAVVQARKLEKKTNPLEGDFMAQVIAALKGDIDPLIEAYKLEDRVMPKKGEDYFTPAEIAQLKSELLASLPKGDKGDTPKIDYDALYDYCLEKIKQIPPAKDGKPGLDAIVDTNRIISEVVKQLPVVMPIEVDYEKVKVQIIELLKKSVLEEQKIVGYSSLRQLTDVILTGVPQDSKGNYILTPSDELAIAYAIAL